MSNARYPLTLVIGYGNELRGDDAAGPLVARQVAGWERPDVEALSAHQLVPEMAERIASADRVIFLDARERITTPTTSRIQPASHTDSLSHISDPRVLLSLALALYQRCPPAWLVGIPAVNFAAGASLSESTTTCLPQALRQIHTLLAD